MKKIIILAIIILLIIFFWPKKYNCGGTLPNPLDTNLQRSSCSNHICLGLKINTNKGMSGGGLQYSCYGYHIYNN